MNTQPAIRLFNAINRLEALLDGTPVDCRQLSTEAAVLVRHFQHFETPCDAICHQAAIIVAAYAEAQNHSTHGKDRKDYLNLCRSARNELRRLNPQLSQSLKILWTAGRRADELIARGTRIDTPTQTRSQHGEPLRNNAFIEALATYGKPENLVQNRRDDTAGCSDKAATGLVPLAGPAAEQQYFSAAQHWSNTGER